MAISLRLPRARLEAGGQALPDPVDDLRLLPAAVYLGPAIQPSAPDPAGKSGPQEARAPDSGPEAGRFLIRNPAGGTGR